MIVAWLMLAASPASAANRQVDMLKEWAMSRCVGKAAGPPFRDDAFASAAALLERADADISVFNYIDALIDRALATRHGGSVKSRYDMLKCRDLYHSVELDRAVRHR